MSLLQRGERDLLPEKIITQKQPLEDATPTWIIT